MSLFSALLQSLHGLVGFVQTYWLALGAAAPVVVLLALYAYFARDLRAAICAVLVVVCMVAAGLIFKHGVEFEHRKVVAAQEQIIREREQTIREVTAESERARADADRKIAELEQQAARTPRDTRPGLDRGAAGRVRAIR